MIEQWIIQVRTGDLEEPIGLSLRRVAERGSSEVVQRVRDALLASSRYVTGHVLGGPAIALCCLDRDRIGLDVGDRGRGLVVADVDPVTRHSRLLGGSLLGGSLLGGSLLGRSSAIAPLVGSRVDHLRGLRTHPSEDVADRSRADVCERRGVNRLHGVRVSIRVNPRGSCCPVELLNRHSSLADRGHDGDMPVDPAVPQRLTAPDDYIAPTWQEIGFRRIIEGLIEVIVRRPS